MIRVFSQSRSSFEQIFATGLAFLLVAATWLFVPQLASPFDVKRHLTGIGLLALALLFVVGRSQAPWRMPSGVVGAALLLLVSAATISASAAQNGSIVTVQLAHVVPFLLMLLCLFTLQDPDATADRVEIALLVATAGVAALVLKQWLLPQWLDPGFHALGKMRAFSTLGNPNLAAFVMLAAAPLAFFRARDGRGMARATHAALLILLAVAMLVTQSRQALLAAAVTLASALVWLGSVRQRRLTLGVLAIMLIAGVVTLIAVGPSDALAHTLKGRWLIWRSALHMMSEHPVVGVGLGHFELYHAPAQAALFATGRFDAFLDNAGAVRDAHNDFLHWGASAGVAGIAAFILLCSAALWKGWRARQLRERHPALYLALVACTCGMLFTAALPHAATALLFWLLLGLVLRYCAVPSVQWKPYLAVSLSIAGVLAAMLIACTVFGYRELRAQLDEGQADRLMEQHDLWFAERKYGDALAWSRASGTRLKHHATTQFLLGQSSAALSELEEAARYSGDVGIAILRAEILTREGDDEQAIALYQRLIAAFPKMITPRFVLAQIHARRGELAPALAQFRKVVEIEASPFNLNLTHEKVQIQKDIARRYLARIFHEGAPE